MAERAEEPQGTEQLRKPACLVILQPDFGRSERLVLGCDAEAASPEA